MKRPILTCIALTVAALPATASAATLEVGMSNGSPAVVYNAVPGEVNAVEMQGTVGGGADLRMPFFSYSAPLTAGPGCIAGFPVLCGDVDKSYPVAVALDDKSDIAKINSFTNVLTMDAGAGNDDVLAGGINANADGGAGNDTIRLAANNVTTGTGGTGHDSLAAGLGAAAATLDGDGGNDLLVPGGFAFNDASGGPGNDRLVSFTGGIVKLAGQTGNDILLAATGNGTIELSGGADDDIVHTHLGGASVSAGSGNDIVNVRGGAATAADTVTCGSGWDVVSADRTDAVASDCELRLYVTVSALPKVTAAQTAAQALLAHMPDPTNP
jgi:Ca2+-binding RTX toxin-like protein